MLRGERYMYRSGNIIGTRSATLSESGIVAAPHWGHQPRYNSLAALQPPPLQLLARRTAFNAENKYQSGNGRMRATKKKVLIA